MKYAFYLALLIFLYRVLFSPKIVVEHRHIHDKKPDDKKSNKLGDFTDFEEVK
jgi:hypothetical protein